MDFALVIQARSVGVNMPILQNFLNYPIITFASKSLKTQHNGNTITSHLSTQLEHVQFVRT